MCERTLPAETVHGIFGRHSPPRCACPHPGARESRWPLRGSAGSPQFEHPRDHPRADLPPQQDGAFRNCDGGVGGLNQCSKALSAFQGRKWFQIRNWGCWGVGVARQTPSPPPWGWSCSVQGLFQAPTLLCFSLVVTLPLPGAQPRHPQRLPDICQQISVPRMSLCPQCQPPWLGSCLLWSPPETPRAGMGWDSPAPDLQPWLLSRHGRGWEIPRFSQRTHPT